MVKNNKLKPYLLLAPITIFLIIIMGSGIVNCILQSVGYFPQIGLNEITFDYYKEILRDSSFLRSLIFTLKTSFVSAVLSVIIGILISYILCKSEYSKVRNYLLNLPIIVPHIVVVFFMITIFSKSGLISRVFYNLGMINDSSQFLSIVFDSNGIGIILVYLWKGIPFTAITVYNILRNINDKLEKVAINLGAKKLQTFRYIALPLAMPTIISSFIILFVFSFGSFEVPLLIGASTPKTLPVQAYTNYISSDLSQRVSSMVINVVLSSISFVLLIIYNKIFDKINKYEI
ncbi:MAG: ABC transporter permease subunit [Romboutsia sp.]